MLLVADAFIVCSWSHESAVGGTTHYNNIGRENNTSRKNIEPGPRGAADGMGRLVDYRRITRRGLGNDFIPCIRPGQKLDVGNSKMYKLSFPLSLA